MTFTEIIVWPFAWLLMTFYNLTTNYGIAVILFAFVVNLVLLYPQMRSKHSMMRTARLTPIMKELEKKHEGNKQKYNEEVSRLYREEHINPMSGCLWSLIPMVFLLLLYNVIRYPYSYLMHLTSAEVDVVKNTVTSLGGTVQSGAYSELYLVDFVHNHFESFKNISSQIVNLNFNFLGMNLGTTPQWNFFTKVDWNQASSWAPALGLFLIPLISGLLSYFAMKIGNATNPTVTEQQQSQMKSMMLVMPLFSVYIGFVMPAALGVYWIANSVIGIGRDAALNKHFNKLLDIEDAERRERMRKREAELERKHQETEKLREQGATERNKNTSKKKIQSAQKVQSEERMAADRAQEKARRRSELGLKDEVSASQVGTRRFARGRAYVEDRFSNPEGAEEATKEAAEMSEIDASVDAEFEEKLDAEKAAETETSAADKTTSEEADVAATEETDTEKSEKTEE